MPPILFVFKNTFKYPFENFAEDDEIYNEKLESDWLAFWTRQSEEIVNSSWMRKYSEYLSKEPQETYNLEEAVSENTKETIHQEDNLLVQNDSIEITSEEDNSCLWQDLWNTHYMEVYEKTFQIFSKVHHHHTNFYRPRHCEEEIPENLSSYLLEEELEIVDQTEQLQALGLPTSFGGSNCKYHRNRMLDWSSDSLSDQETEEELNMTPTQQKASQQQPVHKKKKNRKLKRMPKLIIADKSLRSYWVKRFSLFSRFDEGIKLDRESWFSVTPEKIAIHMAERLRCGIIIDAFCGSGGNSIQFALTCERVIAVDIDPEKIKNARHNANIYGVADKIDFIIGDYLQLSESLKGDVVFLSPPWGGPQYISQKEYDIEESLAPLGATDLASKSRLISENIVFFLPKNSNPKQIVKVAGIGNRVEVEHNYLDTRLVGLTAIYGDWLIDKKNL